MSTEFDALGVISMVPAIWAIISQSMVFGVLKVFLILYSVVMIANVVMLLLMRGITGNLKLQPYGTTRPPIKKNEATKKWQPVEQRHASGSPAP